MTKATDIRYTPEYIIEPVRRLFTRGTIDLDPCSSEQANETIKAERIFTARDNGLQREWHGNVWLNWPGSLARPFAAHLRAEWEEGNVEKAAVMIFNWDHSTRWFDILSSMDPVFVLFKKRVHFPDAEGTMFEVGRSQAIAYIGVSRDDIIREYLEDDNVIILS